MNKIFLSVLFLIFSYTLSAGDPWPVVFGKCNTNSTTSNTPPRISDKDFKLMFLDAQDLFNFEYYDEALTIFKKLLAQDYNNSNLNFYVGVCYLKAKKQRTLAAEYLEKAIKKTDISYSYNYKETSAPVFSYLYLGQVYHMEGKYDEALTNYEKFKSFLTDKNKDGEFMNEVKECIEITNYAKKLTAKPLKVTIEPFKAVNTAYTDMSPVLTPDGTKFYYTSKRKGNMGGQKDNFGEYMDDIYYSYIKDNKWQKPRKVGSKINTTASDIVSCLTPDGSQLFFFREVRGTYDIFFSEMSKRKKWASPEKLGPSINTKFNEVYPFITSDGNTMLFASDRDGGYGGYDIYMSEKKSTGEWSQPLNLGSDVNSVKDDVCPMLLPDGTLYFSSNGHQTMGGFDIFMTTISENGLWATPENIGYPINTAYDDLNFTFITADGKKGYYTSAKANGYGESDIYSFSFD
jgi:tetratricopeptide (TPR) repeat protein